MDFNTSKYFLATNSCEGFFSSFNKCYSVEDDWNVYIIKGGPGTGKSSFMKRLKLAAQQKIIPFELFPCSSDPKSLDAIIFPTKKLVVLDGTAPHTVDPVFPGCCEQILNFSDFWDKNILHEHKKQITFYTNKNRAFHRSASNYLSAAGKIFKDNLQIGYDAIIYEKVNSFAHKICKKYINYNGDVSKEWVRYLGGVTPEGIADFSQSAIQNSKTIISIEDDLGAVSEIIMETVRNWALSKNHQIITIKNSFLPTQITDHIIIPALSLSFVRINRFQNPEITARKIHSSRFLDCNILKDNSKKIKQNNKLINSLLNMAVKTLKEAKLTHDVLESYYINAMDFNKLNLLTERFINENFS